MREDEWDWQKNVYNETSGNYEYWGTVDDYYNQKLNNYGYLRSFTTHEQ